MKNKTIDSSATQVRQPATVVLMRDIIQKTSDTDKQITLALLRPVWLSYLLSIGAISAGTLSVFSAATILGTEPAHANLSEQSVSLPDQTVEEFTQKGSEIPGLGAGEEISSESQSGESLSTWQQGDSSPPLFEEEPANSISAHSSEPNARADSPENLVHEAPAQTSEADVQTIADTTRSRQQPVTLNLNGSGEFNFALPGLEKPQQGIVAAGYTVVPANSFSLVPTRAATDKGGLQPQFTVGDKPTPVQAAFAPSPTEEAPALNSVEGNLPEQLALGEEPTTVELASVPSPVEEAPVLNSVERNVPEQLALGDESTTVEPASVPSPTVVDSTLYKGPGAASLLGGNIQAQAAGEDRQDSSSVSQDASQRNEALTPTLDLQGVFLNQGDSSARARLRGIYPVSPNALFGAVVDLATGEDFAGTEGNGLSLNELYFTGNLPDYPNLRLTAGLMDLTSYFDRNSFAKDSTTHFFNPLFQTNPALAAAGIGSRPGALLNWNVTDNVEAKAAVFSSDRSIGDFSLDAFAGEVGFRSGNAIVRATYASNQDTGRDGVFGTDEGDRENAFGINGELFIPQIKMGLFARYGVLSNSDQDENTQTYNLGFNFLDLFRKDDRLGLGYAYGPDFSEDDDVWEAFYDTRISPNFRAGVTLQARDGFSETIFGFRVKTDLQLYP